MVHPSLILNCVTAVSDDVMLSEREGIGSHLASCDDQEHTKWNFLTQVSARIREIAHRNRSSVLLQEEGTARDARIQLWMQRVSQISLPKFSSDLILSQSHLQSAAHHVHLL